MSNHNGINGNQERGRISRRTAASANYECARCGFLIAAESVYIFHRCPVKSIPERLHEVCFARKYPSCEQSEDKCI